MASCTRFSRLSIGLPGQRLGAYNPTRCLQTSSASQSQNNFYPLYPSVTQLLHENGIPLSDVPKIHASGPQGRLLKGDVLAYIGAIPADYSSSLSERIKNLQHLDLSNVKLAPPPKAPEPAESKAPPPPPQPKETEVAVSVSLSSVLSTQKRIQETLGVAIPLSTFLARATDLANDDLPRSRHATPSPDELFNQVIGARDSAMPSTSRGEYMPEINAKFPGPTPAVSSSGLESTKTKEFAVGKEDIIDILSDKAPSRPSRKPSRQTKVPESGITTGGDSAINVFSLTVPESEQKRAKVFLERVKTVLQVNPGSLVL